MHLFHVKLKVNFNLFHEQKNNKDERKFMVLIDSKLKKDLTKSYRCVHFIYSLPFVVALTVRCKHLRYILVQVANLYIH